MDDQMDDHRPLSKHSCSIEVVERKALPPIPSTPPCQGKVRHHLDQVEQNTQTELHEFSVIGSSNNITERKNRGSRKDAPNPVTGRTSPRKKRTGTRVEPNKKKHHCGLFDGPPPKPERKQPSGFFHPGLASIQGNINTFQPHMGALRLPQSARKFTAKETRYRVDTVHGHRVPVAQELEFGPSHGQKQKWKRRLSPIKRKVEQNEEHVKKDDAAKLEQRPQHIENDDKDIPTKLCEDVIGDSEGKVNCAENVDESEKRFSVNEDQGEINVISEPNADDTVDANTNENAAETLRADDSLCKKILGVSDSKEEISDELLSIRQDGDECTVAHHESIDSTSRGKSRPDTAKSAVIKDTIRELVETIVSKISPEPSNSPKPHLSSFPVFASVNDTFSDNKQFVSIAIQTDWTEPIHEGRTENSPIDDGCSSFHESCVEGEQSTTKKDFPMGISASENCQQLGCVESFSSYNKPTNDFGTEEIQATDQFSDTVHARMNKGTMTPTMTGWRSLEDTSHEDKEDTAVADEPTTPPNPPESMVAQHILNVPGLGRMSMPLQAPQVVHSQASINIMDVVTGSESNSDEQLQGILIEDSAGDYTPAARAESRVSIFTLGHGDQRIGISTPIGNISSSQQDVGNDLTNESGSRDGQASGDDSTEVVIQESRTPTRSQTGNVQELIDNLIAERLSGVFEPETHNDKSTTIEENESPQDDAVQLFHLKKDEVTDLHCQVFGNVPLSSGSHSDVLHNEETPSKDTQPDEVKEKRVTPTREANSVIKSEECIDCESEKDVQQRTDHELNDAFLAMEDAVAAAKLIIRYLGLTDARLRAALHRSGSDDDVVNCPAAERVAQEAHAFAVRTQSVFMTYFRLAEAEDTFREFVLKELPGSEKERRQLRRWWTVNQPIIDDSPDDSSDHGDVLEGEPEPYIDGRKQY